MGSPLDKISELARRLPFDVDDSPAVNAVFSRWHGMANPEDEKLIDLWTYCFVYRYFSWKYLQKHITRVPDFETLLTETYQRVIEKRNSLDPSARYASWVSVVCLNEFRSYLRQSHRLRFVDDDHFDRIAADPMYQVFRDPAALRPAIEAAINRLPEYLVDAARARFLQQLDYDEIQQILPHDGPTLRAYCHKARRMMSEDEELRRVYDQWEDDRF